MRREFSKLADNTDERIAETGDKSEGTLSIVKARAMRTTKFRMHHSKTCEKPYLLKNKTVLLSLKDYILQGIYPCTLQIT